MSEGGARAIVEHLRDAGLDLSEVYAKRGRSRHFEIGPQGTISLTTREVGWAVRAGNRHASFFVSGTGSPAVRATWPEPLSPPIQLPSAKPVRGWKESEEIDSPLIGEVEALALLEGLQTEIDRDLPGATLTRAVLEDGASESRIVSSRGIDRSTRARAAHLVVEATSAGSSQARVTAQWVEREARRFHLRAIARRLVDQLSIRESPLLEERDRGDMLIAPIVGTRLLWGLMPLLVGRGAFELAGALRDRQGRIGSRQLSLIDDGRYVHGVFRAPVDGEGVPTRRVVLVEDGEYRQPLLAWYQASPPESIAAGCMRRPSWRDLPTPGPTHLYMKGQREVSVASLLSEVTRGFYLLDALGPGNFDFEHDRFRIPVCGFVLRGGRASAAFGGAWLTGSISAWLRGVRAVARDLQFSPHDGGLTGTPTTLVTGLELRGAGPGQDDD